MRICGRLRDPRLHGPGGEAGGDDVAELLVLVRQRSALHLPVQRGAADPGREVAPVRARLDGAGIAVRAGRGDGQSGGDEPVAGLDDAGVAVGGAGLDDHDGLRRAGRGVDEGGAGLGGEFAQHIGDGHQVGGVEVEVLADPGPLPLGGAQPREAGGPGQFAAQREGGLGPVQDGGPRPLPGPGDRPARRSGAAADVGVRGRRLQSGAASRRASTADRTASKVAGIRYAAYAATSERSRSSGVSVGVVPR